MLQRFIACTNALNLCRMLRSQAHALTFKYLTAPCPSAWRRIYFILQRVYCVLFGLCTVGDCHSKRQLAEKWAQTKPNKTSSAGPRLSSPMPRMLSSGKEVSTASKVWLTAVPYMPYELSHFTRLHSHDGSKTQYSQDGSSSWSPI